MPTTDEILRLMLSQRGIKTAGAAPAASSGSASAGGAAAIAAAPVAKLSATIAASPEAPPLTTLAVLLLAAQRITEALRNTALYDLEVAAVLERCLDVAIAAGNAAPATSAP